MIRFIKGKLKKSDRQTNIDIHRAVARKKNTETISEQKFDVLKS